MSWTSNSLTNSIIRSGVCLSLCLYTSIIRFLSSVGGSKYLGQVRMRRMSTINMVVSSLVPATNSDQNSHWTGEDRSDSDAVTVIGLYNDVFSQHNDLVRFSLTEAQSESLPNPQHLLNLLVLELETGLFKYRTYLYISWSTVVF